MPREIIAKDNWDGGISMRKRLPWNVVMMCLCAIEVRRDFVRFGLPIWISTPSPRNSPTSWIAAKPGSVVHTVSAYGLATWQSIYMDRIDSYAKHAWNRHLTHWGGDKMAAISQTTLSNAFSWMKILEFRLKLHWSLFLRIQLTIFQCWFR